MVFVIAEKLFTVIEQAGKADKIVQNTPENNNNKGLYQDKSKSSISNVSIDGR